MATSVNEVLDSLEEAARKYVDAKGKKRVELAHELRKLGNRLYSVQKQAGGADRAPSKGAQATP